MIRTIFVLLGSILLTIYFATVAITVGIFNPYSTVVNRVIYYWAKGILTLAGVRVEVSGQENIREGQSYIYIGNHQGMFDILACIVSIPGTVRFIAKKELFRIPIFAQGMRAVGMIPIDRGNSEEARKTINDAVNTLHKGVSVIIFPEGTRSTTGEIKPFKKGGFILALKSGLPIMPLVISGSLQIMPKKSKKLNKGLIRIRFLPPVDSTAYSFNQRNELTAHVREMISSAYRQLTRA